MSAPDDRPLTVGEFRRALDEKLRDIAERHLSEWAGEPINSSGTLVCAVERALREACALQRAADARVCRDRADHWARKPNVRDNLRAEAFSCANAIEAGAK